MSSRTPFHPLPILALLLTLGACATVPEQPAEPSAETIAEIQAAQEHNAWLEQRNQAIQQLRQSPHLSVTEHQNGDFVVQVRSGDIFRTSSTKINPKMRTVFEHIASTLSAHPRLTVLVIGHTDNVGNPQQNLALSTRRAESVHDTLVSLGLDESRVSFEGRGDAEPIAPNTSREGRAVNRRVDLLISVYQPGGTDHAQHDEHAEMADDAAEATTETDNE